LKEHVNKRRVQCGREECKGESGRTLQLSWDVILLTSNDIPTSLKSRLESLQRQQMVASSTSAP